MLNYALTVTGSREELAELLGGSKPSLFPDLNNDQKRYIKELGASLDAACQDMEHLRLRLEQEQSDLQATTARACEYGGAIDSIASAMDLIGAPLGEIVKAVRDMAAVHGAGVPFAVLLNVADSAGFTWQHGAPLNVDDLREHIEGLRARAEEKPKRARKPKADEPAAVEDEMAPEAPKAAPAACNICGGTGKSPEGFVCGVCDAHKRATSTPSVGDITLDGKWARDIDPAKGESRPEPVRVNPSAPPAVREDQRAIAAGESLDVSELGAEGEDLSRLLTPSEKAYLAEMVERAGLSAGGFAQICWAEAKAVANADKITLGQYRKLIWDALPPLVNKRIEEQRAVAPVASLSEGIPF